MKNKHNAFLCIMMCIVLVASVLVACDSKDDEKTTSGIPETGSIVHQTPEEPSYSKVLIEDVELAEIISGALGEEHKDKTLDELNEEEKEAVKDYATDKGYIVEEENGKLNIYESKEEEAPSALVSDIYNQASIKDPNNLTPEEITRLSQVAATNNVQLVTKEDGKVEIVSRVPVTKVVTTKAPVTQKPNHNDNDFKTTIKVEIPSYNPPTAGEVAPMGTTLPKTKLAKAGWLKTYGDAAHHVFTSNATTSDGGVVAVGAKLSVGSDGTSEAFGAIVVKYNKDGSVAWKDTIGSDKICQLENVAVLSDGSIVAVGYTSGTKIDGVTDATFKGPKGSVEGIVVKYSADGTKKFTKMYGGSGSDMIYGVAATSDGGFIIGGKAGSTDGDMKGIGTQTYKAFVMKLNANGDIQWTNALSSSLHSATRNIAVASNGDIYATIETVANDGEFADIQGTNKGLETTVLIKLDKNGKLLWKKCFYGSSRTQLYSVIATSDGCVIAGQYAAGVNGNSGTFKDIYNGGNQGTFDGMLIKLDTNGNQKWMKPLVGFQNDYISDITAVPGGFALSGYTNSTNRDFALKNSGEMDSFVYIVSAYGDLQTVSSFGGSSVDNARGICANGKTVYVCGFTNSADGSFANCSVKGADNKGAALVYQFNLETT